MFSSLMGNDQAKDYLTRMIEKKAMGNSLLFSGPSGVGKTQFALAFATALLGRANHPDLQIFRPEGKVGLHTIESMRAFCRDVYLAPFEGKWKIFIIQDADRMLSYSANALLKTFEEPAAQSLIILISDHSELLLPTVLSRCRTVYFTSLSDSEVSLFLQNNRKISQEQANHLASLAQGSIGAACQWLDQKNQAIRSKVIEILKKGKFPDYTTLSTVCKAFAEEMENSHNEELIQQEIYGGDLQDLSRAQKSEMAKEVEGIVRLKQSDQVQHFFFNILSWYRDLHLLQIGGEKRYLIHKDNRVALEESSEKGALLPLADVTRAIQEAKLAFDRSGTLALCLENLFLKLNYL